ncbi:MAG: Ig-like domain-containing protein [Actinomycetota bacterium]|nr:Ig-like domain-containing protein [Actinomycetota bacterium]
MAVSAAVWATVVILGPPARAQTGLCPPAGAGDASVDVDSPRPGERVSGVVTVQGTVSAARTVSRVELRVGSSVVDSQSFPARSAAGFALRWDVRDVSPGPTTARIVACGPGVGDEVVHGSVALAVEVAGSGASSREPAERPSGPLWVGAVVALSGLAGLAFSGALRRPTRRGPVPRV